MMKKGKFTDFDILNDLPVRVEYLLLVNKFSHYKSPKKKIFDLTKKGFLQHINRGQYFNLKSRHLSNTAFEIVANSLYFPSYVSMEWALQFYGLIPDRVTLVTSVTVLKTKEFTTPYAPFSYSHISEKRYAVGYLLKSNSTQDAFLIARPEKALIDYVNIRAKNLVIRNESDIVAFFEEDLRLDLTDFLNLISADDLIGLLPFYHRNSKEIRILKWLLRRKKEKNDESY